MRDPHAQLVEDQKTRVSSGVNDVPKLHRLFHEVEHPYQLRLRCFIPAFDGAIFSVEWKDGLWASFFMEAPRRRRRSVEQYNVVMSGRRPLIKGFFGVAVDRGCGHVFGLLMRGLPVGPDVVR